MKVSTKASLLSYVAGITVTVCDIAISDKRFESGYLEGVFYLNVKSSSRNPFAEPRSLNVGVHGPNIINTIKHSE